MKTLIIVCSTLALFSCYSYKPMKQSSNAAAVSIEDLVSQIETGKDYQFILSDGKKIEVTVDRVKDGTVSGQTHDHYSSQNIRVYMPTFEDVSISITEIKTIKRKQLSGGKTALAILVPLGVIGAVVYSTSQPFYIGMTF